MRRRRITRKTLGVSLFPFLAVLICTLGVLIVLLVLAVRSADVRSTKEKIATEQRQDELEHQQHDQLSALTFELDRRLVEIEGLELTRPDSLRRLSASRELRGHLESEIRELRQKARQLGDSLLTTQQTQPVADDDNAIESDNDALRQQILVAQKELELKRSESKSNAAVTYAIVPHAGHGGTFRRPIFIECTHDALILRPLGIRMEKSDFAPPLNTGNMLDAALLTIREYWQKYDLEGSEGSPYPLLVVRPDGAETYAIARHAMSSWEDEFGYELVEADKTLDFGTQDEQLAAQVRSVVDEAKIRQQTLSALFAAQQNALQRKARAMGERAGSGPGNRHDSDRRPGLTASGPNGGFVANSQWGEYAELGANNESSSGTDPDAKNDVASTANQFVSLRGHQNQLGNPIGRDNQEDEFRTTNERNDSTGTRNSEFSAARNSAGAASSANGSINESTSTATQASGGDKTPSPSSPYQNMSLAKTRGTDWALPTQSSGATGYVRPIRVVCGADVLEVRSALGVEKRIPIGPDITESIDPLVNEIWRQIEAWGLSGERSYWKPELRISVLSGGELNFEKLRGLLHDSGVDVKETQ